MAKFRASAGKVACLLTIGLLSVPIAANADDVPGVTKGTTELGLFLGSSYGADGYRVMGGGNVSYSVTKWLLPYAEFSYFPGLPRVQTDPNLGSSGGTTHYDLPLADYHAGVHIPVPKIRESRFVPYGAVGIGVIHNAQTMYTYNYTVTVPVNGVSTPSPQTKSATLPSGESFAVNFGGGVRYYINQQFGVRLEAKVYRANGEIKSYFSKYEFGVFYQIHRH